ncbi:centrosomal protein of 162 kDa-like [Oncorhynchus tshawytscha]|uniref:centrosomal protein of 162 kDa-like n=1 Tax=Oncorhynchus tshawytscha TaxID=74940 RepID=UPI001C3D4297|nr:centrosomal protein of 162 kDa-like [Oncorhynchus tshawytscha]
MFRKSLRRSQPIQEGEEELQHQGVEVGSEEEEEGAEPVIFSRDRLEPEGVCSDSVMASGPGQNAAVGLSLGMDSLEEEEEKAHLEGGASSTIDYSRLNKDLDSTSASTTATTLRKAEAAVAEVDQREEEKAMESDRLSPASNHYSEDEHFEDEVIEEQRNWKPKSPAMLTKVSLHDSLDSTVELLPPGADSDTREELGSGGVHRRH